MIPDFHTDMHQVGWPSADPVNGPDICPSEWHEAQDPCAVDPNTYEYEENSEHDEFNENDVFLSSWKLIRDGAGNARFHRLLDRHRARYISTASRNEKRRVCNMIIRTVNQASPPGRFFMPDKSKCGNGWTIVDDNTLRKKIGSLLRLKKTQDLIGKGNGLRGEEADAKTNSQLLTSDAAVGTGREETTQPSSIASAPSAETVSNERSCSSVGLFGQLLTSQQEILEQMMTASKMRQHTGSFPKLNISAPPLLRSQS